MVAIVSGNGLGLHTGSMGALGARGVFGQASQVRTGEGAYVDASTGNLVLQDLDARLMGVGNDALGLRTYNSLGLPTFAHADGWIEGAYRSVTRVDATHLLRTDLDGSTATYTWNATTQLYEESYSPGEAISTIKANADGSFTWTDGTTAATENYAGTGLGLISSATDIAGNTLSFTYNASNQLIQVKTTDSNGLNETVTYGYTGANLSSITSQLQSGALSQVTYTYDAQNRLSTVVLNLSPDGSVPAGSYTTTYTYDGTSNRVASVRQPDGTTTSFTYVLTGGVYKVATFTDGAGKTTSFSYNTATSTTTVTDALGVSTAYTYDANGQLTLVKLGVTAMNPNGLSQVSYTYNSLGDVLSVTDGQGRKVLFTYDAKGNLLTQLDDAGDKTVRTYNSLNQVLTDTTYGRVTPWTLANPETVRYVYSATNAALLRFVLTAEGGVTEYRYDARGQRTATIQYSAGTYAVSGLATNVAPTESQLTTWLSSQDLSQAERTDYAYDYRGQLQTSTTWTSLDATGAGVAGTGLATRYSYDPMGRLLSTISADGKRTTVCVYDGLGREVSRAVSGPGVATETTLTSYDDAHGKTTLTTADGLSVVSTFDGRGRLVSVLQSSGATALGTTTYAYDADGRLLMSTDPNGVKAWSLYDAEGRKVADIDGEGTLTEYVYDASDRLAQTVRYATAVDVTALVDGSGNPTAPALSSIRPTATAQDQKAWTLYDAAGRPAWQVDALGYVTQTDYDGAGRVQGTTRFATPIDVTKLGNGVGLSLATAGTTETALVGDVTGDGKADLVFASAQADGLHIRTRVSNGDGTWTYKDFLLGDGAGVFQTPTLMGDVTGDGKKDLVFIYTAADGIHVRTKISLGNGAWSSKEQILTGDATQVASPVRMGDVNGDGKADLVFSYMVGNDLHVRTLMGVGDGTYVASEQVFTAEGSGYLATPALMGDVTGDGKADLVFTWFDGTNLHIRTKASNGDGTWTSSEQTFADDGTSLSKPVLMGDINGDGKADLLFTTLGTTNTLNLRTKLSNGNGTWTSQSYLAGDGNLALGGQAQLADINADGKADLVYEWTDAANSLHLRSRTWNADGTWTYREEVTAADSLVLSKPVLVGDFSGDGKADLAFISYDATSALTVRTKLSTGTAWSTSVATSLQVLTSTTQDRTTTALYDREGRLRATIDGEGYLTEHVYDAAGREVQTKRYAAKVPGFTSAASILTKVTTARTADNLVGLLPTADPANDIVTFTYYDDAGRVVGQVDGEGFLTETSYDAGGRVAQVIRYAKPAVGTPTTTSTLASLRPATDLEDQKTTYTYDSLGRLSQLTNPEGTITAYAYDTMDRVVSVTVGLNTADVRTDLKQYDVQGRLTAEVTGIGAAAVAAAGTNQTAINTAWSTYATKYAYDAAGRRISQTDPEGGRTVWFYDDAGRVTHVVDPTGKVTETVYDALGRVGSTTVYATALSGTARTALVGGVLSATANAAAVNALAAAKAGATADVYTGTQSVRVWHKEGSTSSISRGVGTFQAGDVVTATVRFRAVAGTKAQVSLGGGTTALVYAAVDATGEWQTVTVSATVAANGTALTLSLYGNKDYTTDNSQSVIYDDVTVTNKAAANGQTTQVFQDGFESGLTGWTTATGAKAEVLTASTPTTYSGAKSARVWHRTGTNSDLHRSLTGFLANEVVTAKVWFKAKAGTSGVLYLGNSAGTNKVAVVGNGDWQQITVTLNVGSSPGSVNIYLYGDNYSTTSGSATDVDSVVYDDVTVSTDQRGVVFQEGFESGTTGWTMNGLTEALPALAGGSSRSNETTSYQYDLLGRLTQVTEAELGTTTTTYDAFGGVSRIQSILVGQSVTTTSTYDRRGLVGDVVRDSTGLAAKTTTTYDAFGRVVSFKDANLKTTTTAYDQNGRVVTVTDPLNQARTLTYDAFGRVLTQVDELGRATSYTYSTANRKLTVTTPEGVSVATVHNAFGQTLTVTDGNNVTTTYVYDLDGNLSSTSTPVTDGGGTTTTVTTTNTYDKADRLISATDADGHVVALRYDAAGRVLTRTVDPGGLDLTTSYLYDGKGRQVGVVDASGTVTQFTYDKEGHILTQVQDPGGLNLTTTYTYDDQGHVLTVTSPGNTVTQYVYDALGRRTQTIVDPGAGKLNLTTTYAYDANGNVVSVKDPNGAFTRYAYDADNRLVYTVDGAGGVVRNDYNKAGRLTQVTRYAKALTAANLTSLATSASVTAIAGMAVATAGSDIVENRVYDLDGRLQYVVDGAGGVTYLDYDANGRVVDQIRYANPIDRNAWLTGQSWSATAGTPCAALTGPTVSVDSKRDAEIHTVYDNLGRALWTLTDLGNGTQAAVVAMAYDAKGNLVSRTAYAATVAAPPSGVVDPATLRALASGVAKDATQDQVTRYVYDAADRVAYVMTRVDKGDQVALTSMTYDKDGNLTGRTLHAKTIPDSTASTLAGVQAALVSSRSTSTDQTTRYVYDAANRVTAILNTYWDGTKVSVVTQSYDGNGNLLKRTAYATAVGIAVNTAQASDAQVAAAVAAAAAAPSKADMSTAYVYDAAGRATAVLSSFDDGTKVAVTTLAYDAAGHLLSRTADATPVTLTTAATPTCLAVATAAEIQAAVTSAQASSSASDQVTRYVYDAAGRMTWSVDALGGVTKQVYDGMGQVVDQIRYAKPINVATWLTGWTAGNPYPAPAVTATTAADTTHDQEVRTVYDAAGRATYTLSSTEDGTRVAVVAQTYDAKGNVITRTAYGTTIAASTAATLTAVSTAISTRSIPAGSTPDAVISRTYDAANRLVFSVDGVGALTQQVFDGIGRLVKQVAYAKTVAVGSLLAPDYAPVQTAGQDRTSLMAYDAAGRLAYAVDALGSVTQSVYDAKGNLVRRIAYADRLNAAPMPSSALLTQAAVAPGGSLGLVADAANDRVTRMAYDAGSQCTFTVDAVGDITRTFYDALGRTTAAVAYAAPMSAANLGALVTLESAAANGVATFSDIQSKLPTPLDPVNDRTSVRAYDAAGRLAYAVDALGYVTENQYDALGQVTKTTRYTTATTGLVGSTVLTSYSVVPTLGTVRGKVTAVGFVKSTDRSTWFGYDAAGRLTSSTDALGTALGSAGHTETYAYDALGNKRSFTNKLGATWNYDYDAAGRMLQQTDPAVNVTTVVQDATTGKLSAGTTTSTALQTRMTYDALGNLKTRTEAANVQVYNADGTFTWGRTTTYGYDALGHQLTVTYPKVGVYDTTDLANLNTDGAGYTARDENTLTLGTTTVYNSFGEAVANVDVAGNVSVKAYDQAGRLTYDVDAAGYVTGYARNAFGEVTALTRYAKAPGVDGTAGTRLNTGLVGQDWTTVKTVSAITSALVLTAGQDRTITTLYDQMGRTVQVTQPQVWVNNGDGQVNGGSGHGYLAAPTTRTSYNTFGEVFQTKVLADAPNGTPTYGSADPAGTTWATTTHYYDKRGSEVATIDPMGYVTTKAYADVDGSLTGQTEMATAIANWNAAAAPLAFSGVTLPATSADDRTTTYAYDQLNRKVTETRKSVVYSVASDGTTVPAADLVTSYDYDALGNLTCTTDALGGKTYSYYDVLGRTKAVAAPTRSSTVDGSSLTPLTEFKRDAFGNVVVRIDYATSTTASASTYTVPTSNAADRTTLTQYDSHGNAIEVTDAEGVNHFTSFDAFGHIAKTWQGVTGNDGVTRTLYAVFGYDVLGRQTSILTPASTSVLSNNVISTVSQATAGSVSVATAYNAFGEMLTRTTSGGAGAQRLETYEYDNNGRVWRTNAQDGNTTVLLFDLQGRQTARITSAGTVDLKVAYSSADAVDAAGNTGLRRMDSKLDLLGRVVQQTLPLRSDNGATPTDYRPVVYQSFDRWGNVISQSAPYRPGAAQILTTTYAYNANNQVIRQTQPDANGVISVSSPITQMYYDALGRQVAVRDANGNVNGQVWDAAGNLVQEVHADRGSVDRYVLDATNKLVKQTYANGGIVFHAYDAFGQQVQLTDAMGNLTQYGYDRLGRNRSIINVGVDVSVSDASFNVSTQRAQNLVTSMVYDEAGRKVRQTDGAGGVMKYTYDLGNNVVATTDGLNRTSLAAFDAFGKQVASQDANGSVATWGYDGFGQLTAHTDLGGAVYSFTYDKARQLTAQTSTRGQSLAYTYDAAGQLTKITEATKFVSDPTQVAVADQTQTTTYMYDEAGRHVHETVVQGGLTYQDQLLGYDKLGRLQIVSITHTEPEPPLADTNSMHFLSGTVTSTLTLSFDYDKVGNKLKEQITDTSVTQTLWEDGYWQHDPGDPAGAKSWEVTGTHTETTNKTKWQNLYFAYDVMNRQIMADGAVNNNASDLTNLTATTGNNLGPNDQGTRQGHLLTYDKNGNRTSDQSWGTQVIPVWHESINASGDERQWWSYAPQSGLVTRWYAYDGMNRLSTVTIGAFKEDGSVDLDPTQGLLLDTRLYDGASRLVESGPHGTLPSGYVTALVGSNTNLSGATTTITRYDAAGQVFKQHVTNEANSSLNYDSDYEKYTVVSTTEYDPDLHKSVTFTETIVTSGYDAAGNVLNYRVTSANNIQSDYITDLVKFEGYKEAKTKTDSFNTTSGYSTSGTTTNTYDQNGFLVWSVDSTQAGNNKALVNDVSGHVLQNHLGVGNYLNEVVLNNDVIGMYGKGEDPDNPASGGVAPTGIDRWNFDLGYEPVTNSYPASATGQYPVQAGDTLESIALGSYGDSDLWYLIAQANGLSGDQDLRVGQIISIPTKVGDIHNSASTHAPYSPSKVVGSTKPNLPTPQGNPLEGDDGCGIVGQVIVAVVVIIVTYYTAGAASAALGSSLGASGGAIVGGIIGGTMGAIAGQDVGMAIGAQDDFDWHAVAEGAISGAVTGALGAGGVGKGATGTQGILDSVGRGVISSAMTQGINVAVGMQADFNWNSVALAAANAAVSYSVTSAMHGLLDYDPKNPLSEGYDASKNTFQMDKNLASSFMSNFAAGVTTTLVQGGRVDYGRIAADAFGNALGSSITEQAAWEDQDAALKAAQKKATSDYFRQNNRLGASFAPDQWAAFGGYGNSGSTGGASFGSDNAGQLDLSINWRGFQTPIVSSPDSSSVFNGAAAQPALPSGPLTGQTLTASPEFLLEFAKGNNISLERVGERSLNADEHNWYKLADALRERGYTVEFSHEGGESHFKANRGAAVEVVEDSDPFADAYEKAREDERSSDFFVHNDGEFRRQMLERDFAKKHGLANLHRLQRAVYINDRETGRNTIVGGPHEAVGSVRDGWGVSDWASIQGAKKGELGLWWMVKSATYHTVDGLSVGFLGRTDDRLSDFWDGRISEEDFESATLLDGVGSGAAMYMGAKIPMSLNGPNAGILRKIASGAFGGFAADMFKQQDQMLIYQVTNGGTGQASFSGTELAGATVSAAALTGAFEGIGAARSYVNANLSSTWGRPLSTLLSGDFIRWTTGYDPNFSVEVKGLTPINYGATYEGDLYRASPAGKDPLAMGDWNINANHRYTGPGQGGLYFASGEHVVEAEFIKNGGKMEGYDMHIFKDQTLGNMLDLTDPAVRDELGVSLEDLTRTGPKDMNGWKYRYTHPIGYWAQRSGYQGVIAPSAQANGGVNVILFDPLSVHK